jgi:hypothetical protein
MRSRFAWLLAGFGIASAVRSRLRRRAPTLGSPPEPPPEPDPRADELRQRITEAREVVGERDAFEEAETPVDADELRQRLAEAREVVDERGTFEEAETPVDEAPDPESRRRGVHDRGRAALDRMRGESPPE